MNNSPSDRFYDIDRGRYGITGVRGLRDLTPTARWEDDFLGAVLDARWAVATEGAGSGAAIVEGQNGVLRLGTGTDTDGGATLALGRHLKANRPGFLMVRLMLPNGLDQFAVEVGLSDALAETGSRAFSSLDPSAPAAVADNAVALNYDSAVGAHWIAAAVNAGGAPQMAVTDMAVADDEWVWLRLDWDAAGNVAFHIDDRPAAVLDAAVNPDAELGLWLSIKALGTAQRRVDLDCVRAAWDRV